MPLCNLCPRRCNALRTPESGEGFCAMGTLPVVARAARHMWEEPCISGSDETRGSGAVFFTHCPLGCIYCQNRDISAGPVGVEMDAAALRSAMLELIAQGADNIDLVTPTHFLPTVLQALEQKLPVPVIYFFARKFLIWGAKQRLIGKICNFFLVKGERAGQKLVASAGRKGLFWALLLFVGIPIPGTGAWTGALGASFLNMGFKSTVVSVCLGVILAGIIMALVSTGVFSII